MGVMEMSHRGKGVHVDLRSGRANLRELLAVPANFRILFMQGGAIAENAIIPLNLLGERNSADYVLTGSWTVQVPKGSGALLHCKHCGVQRILGFTTVPPMSSWRLSDDPAYLFIVPMKRSVASSTRSPRHGAAGAARGAGGRRCFLSHPVAARRFLEIRPAVWRRPEEHRPGRADHRDRSRRPDRARSPGLPLRFRLSAGCRQRLDVQHAAHLFDLCRRAGVRVVEATWRCGGDRAAQRREGQVAVRLPR